MFLALYSSAISVFVAVGCTPVNLGRTSISAVLAPGCYYFRRGRTTAIEPANNLGTSPYPSKVLQKMRPCVSLLPQAALLVQEVYN